MYILMALKITVSISLSGWTIKLSTLKKFCHTNNLLQIKFEMLLYKKRTDVNNAH